MIPFWIGNAIAFVADVELEEVIVLEQHHGLDNLVQPLQAGRQRYLDPTPDGWLDAFELDANASDAVHK